MHAASVAEVVRPADGPNRFCAWATSSKQALREMRCGAKFEPAGEAKMDPKGWLCFVSGSNFPKDKWVGHLKHWQAFSACCRCATREATGHQRIRPYPVTSRQQQLGCSYICCYRKYKSPQGAHGHHTSLSAEHINSGSNVATPRLSNGKLSKTIRISTC